MFRSFDEHVARARVVTRSGHSERVFVKGDGPSMRVLFVTSEVAPFAKTGGLADVCAALPRYLHRAGHDVLLVLPLYERITTSGIRLEPIARLQDVPVTIGRHQLRFSVLTAPLPGSDLPVYFVHCPRLFDRAGIYTSDPDEHLRFVLLSWAALVMCQRIGFAPDIVHCNDWQSALIPLLLRTMFAWDRLFARAKTVLTIHNLNYQGRFPAERLPDTGLEGSSHLFHQDQLRAGVLNFLLTGILYAGAVTTVSPTYAREIQTPEHGAELDPFLRARSSTVVGILNGIDDEEWDPATDRYIARRYDADSIDLKEDNKVHLLTSLGLPYAPRVPTLGIVSRLTSQKGFDLVFDALPSLLARRPVRLAVLGSGDPQMELTFTRLQRSFPRQVCFFKGYSNQLAHSIEAGADIFLMPSRYEPCGLNQMYSQRYGTVPIVRRTGGLADSVDQHDPRTGSGTGFVFEHYDATGLRWAIVRALDTYAEPALWRRLQRNGMSRNFSWSTQGKKYETLYALLQNADSMDEVRG